MFTICAICTTLQLSPADHRYKSTMYLTRSKMLAGVVVTAALLLLYKLYKKKTWLNFVIGSTWDGKSLGQKKAWVMLRRGDGDVIEMHVRAPFYGDPTAPSGPAGEPFPELWDYEVVEAFFLAESGKYLEVELCPHGQHLLLMLNGQRIMVKDKLPVKFDYRRDGNEWVGTAYLPLEYFPPGVSKFNAYAIHGSGGSRQYEAHAAVPGPQPDFHRLEYFVPIDFSALAPENAGPRYRSVHWSAYM